MIKKEHKEKHCISCKHSIKEHKDNKKWNCNIKGCYCNFNSRDNPDMFIENRNEIFWEKDYG